MSDSLGTSVALLWGEIARRRALDAAGSSEQEYASAMLGAYRAADAADNLRYTEKLRRDGWHQPGVGLKANDPRGRGWHDAHMPAKSA